MSRILFKQVLLPSPADPVIEMTSEIFNNCRTVANLRSITKTNEELIQFKDRSVYRSMSRAAVLLSACALGVAPHLERFKKLDPFSIGIYSIGEWGSIDYSGVQKLADASWDNFADYYKRNIPPKQPLKHSVAMAGAHLGIFLKAMGPINTYTHSVLGCQNAVDQAELDLETGVVKAAIVCSAMSTEDHLICFRCRQGLHSDTVLSEGAAVILLEASTDTINWNAMAESHPYVNYGIATPLIQVINQGNING